MKAMRERTCLPFRECREYLLRAKGDVEEAVRLAKAAPRPRWTYLDGDKRPG